MMAKLILLLMVSVTFQGIAQDSIPLPSWVEVAQDYNEQFYLVLENGDLQRISAKDDGQALIYSPVKKARISQLDVSNPLRLFLFYEDLQEYVILDRFLTESGRYGLTAYTSYAGMAAPSLNNLIWIVDMADFSLSKIDPQREQVQIRVPLPQVLDPDLSEFTFLREYQNLLFLVDKKSGIYIFDNLGNFLRSIEAGSVIGLRFLNKKLYYVVEDNPQTVYTQDIYSGERDEIALPRSVRAIIPGPEHLWLFGEGQAVKMKRE